MVNDLKRDSCLASLLRTGNLERAVKILNKIKHNEVCKSTYSKTDLDDALFWASVRGLYSWVKCLLQIGASVNSRGEFGETPLHAATSACHVKITRYLLLNGADVDQVTINGDTASHIAASKGQLIILRQFVQHGANLMIRNKKGHDVMDEALLNRRQDIVNYIYVTLSEKKKSSTSNTVCFSSLKEDRARATTVAAMDPKESTPSINDLHARLSFSMNDLNRPPLNKERNNFGLLKMNI